MKRIAILIVASLLPIMTFGQDITGQWNGILKVQGIQLRIIFNVTKNDTGYSATMDSPDQKAKGIPVTKTSVTNSTLKFSIPQGQIEYEGVWDKNELITGTFRQGGLSVPLNLSRKMVEKDVVLRPQEPKKPYPYRSEDITFENKEAGVKLAGTLTLPVKEGSYPAVILITGSGPQNRDEEIMGHKPFLVIADYLTRNGIAVLRFDDRGTASSTGNFRGASTADFATDVHAGLQYLLTRKEINRKKIGLIGHSEGGIIAPMVANQSKDVSFIILLAGPGLRGDQLLLLQQELIGRASGVSEADLEKGKEANKTAFEMVIASTDDAKLTTDLTAFISREEKENPSPEKPAGMSDEAFIKLQVGQIANPWMKFFIRYDPAPALEKLKCPVLALNGSKDLQVPAKENLQAVKKALDRGGNKKFRAKELPGLNHLFQECKTGAPEEYATIEQTFSPVALSEMLQWIRTTIR